MERLDEILAVELKERLERGERPQIVDVRESEEIALAAFPHALHIPMGEVPSRLAELDPDRETIVVCHHGVRSAHVAMYLSGVGFTRILNLAGGIDAYALTADPSIPRY